MYRIIKMNFVYLRLLVPMLLHVQLCTGVNRYCREAVNSVEIVKSCPSSKAEWDDAARRKDCSRLASKQNCTTAEKFQYHCVINGYRNVTLEVCAPTRIIFGHCVEFNVPGGVIQDQRSAPCKTPFPRCANIYNSWEAYKYPDCYMLVTMSKKPEHMTTIFPTTTSSKTTTEESFSAGTIMGIVTAAVVLVLLLVIFVAVVLLCKRKQRGTKNKKESTSSVPLEANSGQESPPAWFDPKVTPRQLSETGGAKFKSAGEVVAEKSSVSPTTARNENSTKDKLGKHSYDHQTEPEVEPSNTTPLNFQTFVRADLKEEQIRGFGSFSDDGWSSHSQQASEDAEDQDGNTRATDDHVQSARSGTDTGDNPTIFGGSTVQSASDQLDEVFQLNETQAEQSHTSENTCKLYTEDLTDTQEDRINLLPTIHKHRRKLHPPKRRGSLNSESLALHQKKLRAAGRKRTFSAGF